MVRFDASSAVVDSMQGSGSGIESVNGLAMGKSNEFYLTGVYGPEFTLGEKSVSGVSPIINAYLAQVDDFSAVDQNNWRGRVQPRRISCGQC